ncbi:hypothetical protein IC575_023040 [Cucumis melo]
MFKEKNIHINQMIRPKGMNGMDLNTFESGSESFGVDIGGRNVTRNNQSSHSFTNLLRVYFPVELAVLNAFFLTWRLPNYLYSNRDFPLLWFGWCLIIFSNFF